MKKTITLLILLFTGFCHAQYTLIPDPNFEQGIYDHGFDDIIDGQVLTANIANVTQISMVGYNIQSLEGIEDFTSLQVLECRNSQVTTLDVSGLSNLEYLDISYNQLTSLNVTGLMNLQYLSVGNNQLNSIDVSSLPNLQHLDAYENLLTAIDVSTLSNLQYFNCQNNYLSSIDISSLSAMTYFNCDGNQLTNLNLSGLINLQQLRCHSNQLTSLDAGGLTNLRVLYCGYNQISSLNVSNLPNLRDLICCWNQLSALDVSGLFNLEYLNCAVNQILSLDTTDLIDLLSMNCADNQLSSLDLRNSSNLQYLSCQDNQINSLDVTGLTNLISLHCNNNHLPSLSLGSLTNLHTIWCWNNQLTILDVSGLTNLWSIQCYNNQINSINLNGLTSIGTLNCYNNQLTSLNLSGLTDIYQGMNCSLNSGLSCIQVNNVAYANSNSSWIKDANAIYALNCGGIVPLFSSIAPICSGAVIPALPTTSSNGITGTWSPALNNSSTTTYTFTPASGQSATTATMTIVVNPNITPTFAAVSPICSGQTLTALPTTSLNGVTGTWSPALNNRATTTYTFTPAAGQCAIATTLTIIVNPIITPTFAGVSPICSGGSLSALPTTSLNGITGTWSPALDNSVTTTYMFTPTAGQCAKKAMLTITVNPTITPTFTAVSPICAGKFLAPLPTTSNNGVNGTWSPALNNMATTTYTFSPNPGQCAFQATTTISVFPATVGGSVTGGTTVCKNAPSGLLTLSGHNGGILRWESSTDNFATITTIANTSSTYTSGPLSRTTKFRAVIQGCSSEVSASTTVTVSAFCSSLRPVANVFPSKIETKVYPNPTSGNFTLDIVALKEGVARVEICSLSGAVLKTEEAVPLKEGLNSIFDNISDLASGVYLLRVTNGDSNEIVVKRLIKQ